MTLGSGAFYCVALGLLALGLRELLTGCEENRCSMTYMFEYPEYRRVALPRRVARLYPAYGLYLYGEGVYAQETRALKLTGAPVLFLPGNAGSYKQARSLGSVALRKAENMEGGLHFNVFTVDFNEELVALYGGSLLRQTHFLHESIKAILRLYKHLKNPPQSVVLVGHSMGGVVARALFTLPRFNTNLVGLILTQASPHLAPVLALDPYLLDFYSAVKQKWLKQANKLRNITVLSVGGGYRDYQVRSGLTSLPELSCTALFYISVSFYLIKATAVPRTWVSTDHLSIVWCKELVLATVRAFFDLIDPETRQFTDDPEKKMSVLNHHFVRHPVRMVGETPDTSISTLVVVSVALCQQEGQVKYFMFALSSRRKAYSHFYCRSSNLVSSVASLLVSSPVASQSVHFLHTLRSKKQTLSVPQFTVECEWQRQESHTLSVFSLFRLIVNTLSLTVSDVTVNSSGLLHTVELQHFHQGYQAFRVNVASQCKVHKERLSNVYRIMAPWFREDSLTTVSVPSVTEISGMVHTSRPDNTSAVRLQLHTAPNCQYKILRFCGPMVPVYTAVTLLLACGGQLSSILKSRRPADMSQVVGKGLQPHKVNLPVYVLHVLLSLSISPQPFQAPRKHNEAANGTVDADSLSRSKECNGAPLLSECAVRFYRMRNVNLCLTNVVILHRYSTQLDPDPCWPYVVPLVTVYILLINCNTLKLCSSKLLPLTSCLPLPLAVTMVAFSPLHLYRVTYFLLLTLVPLASCCLL
uniref:GPI inositol-deacylase n=1 Tax=Scophthalmus maximus TaxID=52904 RepID=A0A8D3B873_SCOMX